MQEVATDEQAWVEIVDTNNNARIDWEQTPVGAGERKTDWEIELAEPLTKSRELLAVLRLSGDDQDWPSDSAMITLGDTAAFYESIGPKRIEADEQAGFNFPYFLYAPPVPMDETPRPLLVEPNNTGRRSDDFDLHLDTAEMILAGGPGRHIADELAAPLLVPVLPRPLEEDEFNPQNLWRRYLDNEHTPYSRPDLQVLAMAEDARQILTEVGYPVDEDGLMLTGFSQSGDWVGLFTALHPEEVRSVSAGGVNGMPILPIEDANGYTLDYHVGVANVEELVGKSINVDEFSNVNQFYYMGEFDDSDTLTYYRDPSLFEKAKHVYGRHMIQDRFPYAKSVYDDEGFNAIFRVYKQAGHTPRPAYEDLVEFHRRSLAGEVFDAIRDDISGNVPDLGACIEFAPNNPTVGEEMTFDARRSMSSAGTLESFEWELAGETQTGPVITASFNEAGGHTVLLNVRDAEGNSHRAVEQLVVNGETGDTTGDTTTDLEDIVLVSDQTTDGTEIILDRVESTEAASLGILHYGIDETIVHSYEIEAGFSATEYAIEVSPPLTEGGEMAVSLYPRGGGSSFARDTATLTIDDAADLIDGIGPTLIDADSANGFNYPYVLYAPATLSGGEPLPVMVEPTNSGMATDDFDVQLDWAEETIEDGLGRTIADALQSPLVVPVFPRPISEPVDGNHYIHALDRETIAIDSGPLERVDLQLLAMVEDARKRLDDVGYPVDDEELMLTGFSASGNFVERFTALHPTKVHSVTAGGLNGMVTLPAEEVGGQSLPYHIGISNLESLIGEPFDLEAYRNVPQFLYLGELDVNDTLSYDDAWTGDDWRNLALETYGGIDMQGDRFPLCRAVHDEVGTSAIFRLYEDAGHTPRPAYDQLIEFHERVLAGEDISSIRQELAGGVPHKRANIQFAPKEPVIGERVAFHAVDSEVDGETISAVEWTVGEEKLSEEWIFATEFETAGVKRVTLRVTTTSGEQYEASEFLSVSDSTASKTPASPSKPPATPTPAEGDSIPGFGLLAGLSGIGGVAYVLKRRLSGETEPE